MVGENGTPLTPDWRVEPRECELIDLLGWRKARDLTIPPSIVLGEN